MAAAGSAAGTSLQKRALSNILILHALPYMPILENSQVIDFYSLKNPDQLVETSIPTCSCLVRCIHCT